MERDEETRVGAEAEPRFTQEHAEHLQASIEDRIFWTQLRRRLKAVAAGVIMAAAANAAFTDLWEKVRRFFQ